MSVLVLALALGAPQVAGGLADVERTDQWIVKSNESPMQIWTISTPANKAYPTAVCRTIVPQGQGSAIHTEISCGASQKICDGVRDDFAALDEQARRSLSGK